MGEDRGVGLPLSLSLSLSLSFSLFPRDVRREGGSKGGRRLRPTAFCVAKGRQRLRHSRTPKSSNHALPPSLLRPSRNERSSGLARANERGPSIRGLRLPPSLPPRPPRVSLFVPPSSIRRLILSLSLSPSFPWVPPPSPPPPPPQSASNVEDASVVRGRPEGPVGAGGRAPARGRLRARVGRQIQQVQPHRPQQLRVRRSGLQQQLRQGEVRRQRERGERRGGAAAR